MISDMINQGGSMDKNQIASTRKGLGLNQVEFAQLFGIHQMTVSRWERGELSPTPYQQTLLNEFQVAVKEKEAKKNQDDIRMILLSAGIVAAILFILTLAKEGKK